MEQNQLLVHRSSCFGLFGPHQQGVVIKQGYWFEKAIHDSTVKIGIFFLTIVLIGNPEACVSNNFQPNKHYKFKSLCLVSLV